MLQQPGIPTHSPTSTSWKVSNATLQDSPQGTTAPQAVYLKLFPTSDGEPCKKEAKMVMMYRITYGLIDISATSLLHPATLSTRGNSMRYLQPFCRTDAYRCSFFPSGIRLWNQLPECVVTAPTLETFKGGLPGHY